MKKVIQISGSAALVISVALLTGISRAGNVGTTTPLVIPFSGIIGGTDLSNNFKNNPKGGYFSNVDNINQFKYPDQHGNNLGNTAIVNDGTNYWDHWIWLGTGRPGGLSISGVPEPDDGAGNECWWPAPGEWASYAFNVNDAGNYEVLYRFASEWGPDFPVTFHMTVDDVSSGVVPMKPDNMDYWTPQSSPYQRPAAGYWGHDYVPGTVPKSWSLKTGAHVLKVFIDAFPKGSTDHGGIWVHYFKILASNKTNSIQKSQMNLGANAIAFSGTEIQLDLVESQKVTVKVFDHSGRQVQEIVKGYFAAGKQKISWNANSLVTGNYLVQLEVGNKSVTRWVPVLED